jgi:hypothetical protein
MRFNRQTMPRDEPFYWWGPALARREPQSLPQLVEREMLSAEEAVLLSVLYRQGASIFIVSLTSGAGKSTLLDAIVQSGVEFRELIYLRGLYETFDFVDGADRARASLLVNEISPYLPIYLWGPEVRGVFELAGQGYQLCATVHAADTGPLVHLLTSPPLSVPLNLVHQPKVVVVLNGLEQGGGQVVSVAAVTPGGTPQSTVIQRLSRSSEPGAPARIEAEALTSFLHVAGLDEAGFFQEFTGTVRALKFS